jgi:hypothetical protein
MRHRTHAGAGRPLRGVAPADVTAAGRWPRRVQRHGIRRLPEGDGALPAKPPSQQAPLGDVPLDLAAGQTAAGRLSLGGARDRASTAAVAEWPEKATRRMAAHCRRARIAVVPAPLHTVLTAQGTPVPAPCRQGAAQPPAAPQPEGCSRRPAVEEAWEPHGSAHRLTPPGRPGTNGQGDRLNRPLQEATVTRYADDNQPSFKEPLDDVGQAYACAQRRHTLPGLTPEAYSSNCWPTEPERWHTHPCHHTLGLNI